MPLTSRQTIPNSGSREGVEKKEDEIRLLRCHILRILEHHTAGSPTEEKVKWTDLHPRDIATHLRSEHRLKVSHKCIKRVLRAEGFVKRKPIKSMATGKSPHRAAQFKIICSLLVLFEQMGNNPILSIDTKKKEPLGNLTRNQALLTGKGEKVKVYSADYAYLADDRAVPHGIFDIKLVKGYISIGNSNETAAFVVDNLEWWWESFGMWQYQDASHILVLCDSGGANGHRHHLFKILLQRLAKQIGIRIVIAHYPPYCSRYNPIERKLFAHVHRTIKDTVLVDLEQVKQLMEKTRHKKGLTVVVRIVDRFYPLKQPSNEGDINERKILRHPELPQFSYTILP